MNSITCSRIYFKYTIVFAKSLSVSPILYKFTICHVIFLWIHYFSPNSLWIQYLFSRLHFEFTIWFPKSITINSRLFRNLTLNSLSFTRNHYKTLSFSRNHYEFTVVFAKSLYIHYRFREITLNTLSFSRSHYLFR